MQPTQLLFVASVVAFTAAAAVSDLSTRKLPNWLTLSAFVAGLLMHTVVNGIAGLGFALLGFVTGFGILLVLWLIGGSGGGDVKLMGALGAWLGAGMTLQVFLVSTALAGVAVVAVVTACALGYGYSTARRRYLAAGAASPLGSRKSADDDARRQQRHRRRVLPYAVPVALGTWLVLAVAWVSAQLPW